MPGIQTRNELENMQRQQTEFSTATAFSLLIVKSVEQKDINGPQNKYRIYPLGIYSLRRLKELNKLKLLFIFVTRSRGKIFLVSLGIVWKQ